MNHAYKLSIIVPVYNEEESLPGFHNRLHRSLLALRDKYALSFETLYIDDGSLDNSLQVIRSLSTDVTDVRYITFSRNFGKEAALAAGIDHCHGDAVVFLDSDGQHPPELLDKFINRWINHGDDVIYAVHDERQDHAFKQQLVGVFYKLVNSDYRFQIPQNSADFKLLSPAALKALRSLPEKSRFFKGLSAWIGFKQYAIAYQPDERIAGTTKWSFLRLLSLSFLSIVSFSTAPLRAITIAGTLVSVPAFIYGFWILFEKLLLGVELPGYPSLITAVVFLGGIQLIFLGVIGEYIAHILNEVKGRPVYIVKDDITLDRNSNNEPS
ncbi:MAG: glycosyltransferase family 2 protein [Amphritea sp.]|nr:glycosyltransferase family 2 protein [Amphritea sp.]